MGEEETLQPQEEQQQEEEIKQEQKPEEETSLVKTLRKKLEETIKERNLLLKQLEEMKAVGTIANIDEITEKLKKVEKLEFENNLVKKYPFLAEEAENIWKMRKEDESLDDVVARYLGKKALENQTSQTGYSLGSRPISPNLQEPDLMKLPPEERRKKAEELFKQIYGIE